MSRSEAEPVKRKGEGKLLACADNRTGLASVKGEGKRLACADDLQGSAANPAGGMSFRTKTTRAPTLSTRRKLTEKKLRGRQNDGVSQVLRAQPSVSGHSGSTCSFTYTEQRPRKGQLARFGCMAKCETCLHASVANSPSSSTLRIHGAALPPPSRLRLQVVDCLATLMAEMQAHGEGIFNVGEDGNVFDVPEGWNLSSPETLPIFMVGNGPAGRHGRRQTSQ